MPDRGRIIRGFECCHIMVHDMGPDKSSCDICPYKDAQTEEQIDLGGIECIAALHDDAMVLLKEQEAIEPDIDSEGTCSCGNCGTTVGYYPAGCSVPEKLCKYCPECGREVKWE